MCTSHPSSERAWAFATLTDGLIRLVVTVRPFFDATIVKAVMFPLAEKTGGRDVVYLRLQLPAVVYIHLEIIDNSPRIKLGALAEGTLRGLAKNTSPSWSRGCRLEV